MRKSILVFFMLVFLATLIFAMGGKPMHISKDPMRPDTAITLSKEEANKLLKEIKQKVRAELPGIDVAIQFVAYDDFKLSARAWQPDLWIGNWAVEYSVQGADLASVKEIRDKIQIILLAAKNKIE